MSVSIHFFNHFSFFTFLFYISLWNFFEKSLNPVSTIHRCYHLTPVYLLDNFLMVNNSLRIPVAFNPYYSYFSGYNFAKIMTSFDPYFLFYPFLYSHSLDSLARLILHEIRNALSGYVCRGTLIERHLSTPPLIFVLSRRISVS